MSKLRKFDGIGTANWKANSKTLANRHHRKLKTQQKREAEKRKKDWDRAKKKEERDRIKAAEKAEKARIAAAKKAAKDREKSLKAQQKAREKALKAQQKAREKHQKNILKLNGYFLNHDIETHIDDFDLRDFALKYIEENGLRINATSFKKIALK